MRHSLLRSKMLDILKSPTNEKQTKLFFYILSYDQIVDTHVIDIFLEFIL